MAALKGKHFKIEEYQAKITYIKQKYVEQCVLINQ